MKINCKRNELANILHKIAKVITIQKGQPILSNILMTIDENLTIECRSLTSYLKLSTSSKIIEKGQCCTLASKIIEAIDSFACEYINLETLGNLLIIEGDGTTLKLETVNPEFYPSDKIYNNFKVIQSLKLKNEDLNEAIQKCIPFVNDRGVTSGVNFNFKGLKLRTTGVSSIAAGFIDIDIIDKLNESFVDFTLSAKDATIITNIFNQNEISIDIADRYIKINTCEGLLIINKLEGRFPDFSKILNSDFRYKLPINKFKMEESFKLIDIITTSNIATIGYSNNKCYIGYSKLVKSVIDIEEIDLVDFIKFGINYYYLRKIFKFLTEDNLNFYFEDVQKPLLIKNNNAIFFISLATAQKVDF